MNRKVLIGIGVGAALVAPAVAVICDRRAKAKLGEIEKEKIFSVEEIKKEPLTYLPMVLAPAVSIAVLIGLNKKFVGGVAACSLAASTYARRYGDLMEKVQELTPKKAEEFKKRMYDNRSRDYIEGDENEIIAYEMFSGRMFHTTEQEVIDAENTVDRILCEHDDVTLNDFYDCLGIETSIFGSQWGLNIYENITNAGWNNTWIEVEDGKKILFIDGPKWELLF